MNTVKLAENLGSEQAEKIATKIIRNKMTREDINLGEAFQLETFGPPISAKLEDLKTKHNVFFALAF